MHDRPAVLPLSTHELLPARPVRRVFPHPPPPLVSDSIERTQQWKRPIYAPTMVLPLEQLGVEGVEAEPPPKPLVSPVKAPPPKRPAMPPLTPPSFEIPIDVERPATEEEWEERETVALVDRPRDWSVVVVVALWTALGAATWLGLAQLGVT